MNIPGKLVVRTYAPARRWIVTALLLLFAALALYGSFQLGRYMAGFDAARAAAARDALGQQIAALQTERQHLQMQLAAAEEARVADVRERAEVARTIGELQAQIERQQQDVDFYRGLAHQPGTTGEIKVRQFRIVAMDAPQAGKAPQYSMRFNLSRSARVDAALNGTVVITLEGTRAGAPVSTDLAALTGAKGDLTFNFRYFTHIEQVFSLPDDFKPDRVNIEVRVAHKGAAPVRQTFVWTVDPA